MSIVVNEGVGTGTLGIKVTGSDPMACSENMVLGTPNGSTNRDGMVIEEQDDEKSVSMGFPHDVMQMFAGKSEEEQLHLLGGEIQNTLNKCGIQLDVLEKINLSRILWLWTFFSNYKTINYNPKLKGNSSNAKFCSFECITNTDNKEYIFCKIQLSESKDDMLVDNINGYIFNRIINQMPDTSAHFMTYLNSCFVLVNGGTKLHIDDVNPIFCSIPNGTEAESQSLVLQFATNKLSIGNGNGQYKACKASFHKLVEGNMSFSEYLKGGFDIGEINGLLTEFFVNYHKVGSLYGVCHNDAHLENILIREERGNKSKLVLIDYGRVIFFDLYDVAGYVQRKIALENYKYGVNTYEVIDKKVWIPTKGDYSTLINEKTRNYAMVALKAMFERSIPQTREVLSKWVFMFDVMAICMTTCVMLKRRALSDNADDNVKKYVQELEKLIIFEPNGVIHIAPQSSIYNTFHNPNLLQHSPILIGLYWFSVFMESMHLCAEYIKSLRILEVKSQYKNPNNLVGAELDHDVNRMVEFKSMYENCILKAINISTINNKDGKISVNVTDLSRLGIMHIYFQVLMIPAAYWDVIAQMWKNDGHVLKNVENMFEKLKANVGKIDPLHSGGKAKKSKKKIQKKSKMASNMTFNVKKVSNRRFDKFMGAKMMGGEGRRNDKSGQIGGVGVGLTEPFGGKTFLDWYDGETVAMSVACIPEKKPSNSLFTELSITENVNDWTNTLNHKVGDEMPIPMSRKDPPSSTP